MRSNTPEEDRPYWLILLIGIGLWLFYEVWANQVYSEVMALLSRGIAITVLVTLVAFGSACLMGLGLALAGLSCFYMWPLPPPLHLCWR
jgi:ABC-type amino acid transport system permease subunit